MKLLNVIKCAAKMLNLAEVEAELCKHDEQNVLSKDAKMLIDCANLVCNEICSEYFKLKTKECILPQSSKVSFECLQKDIFQIIGIFTEGGKPLEYAVFPLYFEILDRFAGNIVAEYFYIPPDASKLSDSLEIDKRVTDRVFAYGICSEYHLLCGNYDESLMFDKKFRDSLLGVAPKRSIKVPARSWS